MPDLKILDYERHVLVCTGPRCAPETSSNLYALLKQKLKDLKLSHVPGGIQRSQCHCFGVCQGGPLLVVYPEGVWYQNVTSEILDKIILQHLIQGNPVQEHVFHRMK